MPQDYNPGSGQDWAPVNVGRSGGLGGPLKTSVPKTARAIDQAKAAGLVATEKKYGAGGNKSAHAGGAGIMSTKKLEEATDVGTIVKVDKSLSKAIMQARTAKKLTQKELATAINEKPQVIGDYEAGRAIPNPQIIGKLERSLGVKLPRPNKSKPPPKATGGGGASGPARAGAKPGGNGVTRGGPPKRR